MRHFLNSHKYGSKNSWRVRKKALNKSKSPNLLSLVNLNIKPTADKTECFVRKFSSISTLDTSGKSLPDFPARTKYLLSDINIIPSIVSKVDTQKTWGLDGIPAFVLRKCTPERPPVLSILYKNTFLFLPFQLVENLLLSLRTLVNLLIYRIIIRLFFFLSLNKVLEDLINFELVKYLTSHGILSELYSFCFSRSIVVNRYYWTSPTGFR